MSETDASADDPETGDNNNDIASNTVEHHNGQHNPDTDVSKPTDVVNNADDHSDDDGAVAASNKKPKLESLNDCDKEDFDPIGDRNVLHSIMSQIDVYNRPFPSPDHTYAISPVKEEKEEIKTEPLDEEDDDEATPTYRNRLRQRKSPKYNQSDEDYFLMCQEELLNSLKKKHIKKQGNQVKKEEDEEEIVDAEPKEIEYRTINWPKDALYFSYEPNFLFNDEEDDEIEFVCDCCDPKRRKSKKPSSEECSEEEEISDKEVSDEEDDKVDDDDTNDLLDEDSEDSRGLTSREDSPAVETTPVSSQSSRSSKPLPPGWFGKGRSKRRRK